MRPLYRAGQRDTCTVRSQPVDYINISKFLDNDMSRIGANAPMGIQEGVSGLVRDRGE